MVEFIQPVKAVLSSNGRYITIKDGDDNEMFSILTTNAHDGNNLYLHADGGGDYWVDREGNPINLGYLRYVPPPVTK